MAQWKTTSHVQFIIGIVDIVDTVNKPRITIGIWIGKRHRLSTLQRKNEVFGIEHVQNRIDAVAIDLCHIACSLTDGLENTVHLW